MDGIRLDVSLLVGLITQAVLFGTYQVLFFACIYVLLNKRSGHINWPFLSTAVVMWILIGLYLGLSWSRIMDAFIGLQSSLAENPNAIFEYFEDLSHWQQIFRGDIYLFLTAIADSLLVYRSYVVWCYNKYIVILPVLMLCGTYTSAIAISIINTSGSIRIFTPVLTKWARVFFATSLAQCVLTTFLIIFRIWWVSNGIASLKHNSLWPVVTALLESGAIYSSTLLVLLGTYTSGSYAQYIAIDMVVPIIGITFNLIIVRVGLGLSHDLRTNKSLIETTFPAFNKLPLQRLTIDVTQHVHTSQEMDETRTNMPKMASGEDDASSNAEQWKTSTISEDRCQETGWKRGGQ